MLLGTGHIARRRRRIVTEICRSIVEIYYRNKLISSKFDESWVR